MEVSRFSPLLSLHKRSYDYAVAWCGIRSAHEAKKLNTHSLDHLPTGLIPYRSTNSSYDFSQAKPPHSGSPAREGNFIRPLEISSQELPFPLELKCSVIVELRDKSKTQDCVVLWVDPRQFTHVNDMCKQLLRALLEECNAPKASPFLKSGILKLFLLSKDSTDQPLLALERCQYGRDWSYHVPSLALKFGLKYHPQQQLRLQVHWSCDFIPTSIDSEKPLRDCIWHLIHERLKRNQCWGGKQFLSRKEVDAIFNNEIVEALIKREQEPLCEASTVTASEMRTFLDKVRLKGTRLLAICIYGRLPLSCLYKLIQCGLEDAALPLEALPEAATGTYCDHVTRFQDHFVPFDFQRAPDDGEKFHRLSADTVVPLFERGFLGAGGYGEVFDVEIHPEHHDFTPNPEARFALKRFKFLNATLPGDPNQNPENEKDLLDQLVELRNPNITVPLAAWEQSGIFYMLFPKAECSLKTFLNEQSAPSTSDETFLQLVQQLINLSHALDSIHNLRGPLVGAQTQRTNEPQQADSQGLTVPLDRLTIRQQTGYHHDLKPDNILIFPGGMWTINDFGTARIHEAVANSSYRTPNLNGGEATYAPPDYESRGESSRPYDIWSLGCIFLEVLIWLFSSGSGKGLADFATQRMLDEGESVGVTGAFWHMKEGRPKLRPSVKKQFEQLKMDAKDKSQFLTLVNLTEKMLSPDSNRRPEAGQIRSRLEAMQQEALRFLSRGKEESRNTEPMYYPATLHSQGRTVEDGQSSPADMDEYEGSGDSQLSPRIGRKRRLSSVSNDGNLERSMGRPRLESLFLPGAQAAGALLSSPGRASPVPSIVLDGAAIFDEDLESHDSVLPPDMKLEDFR